MGSYYLIKDLYIVQCNCIVCFFLYTYVMCVMWGAKRPRRITLPYMLLNLSTVCLSDGRLYNRCREMAFNHSEI